MIIFLLVLSTKALASYTATGQPCELSPDRSKPETLAICDVETIGQDLEIRLIGARPNKVTEIRFIYSAENSAENHPRQILKLNVTPLIDPETVAVMFVDFNFDGHKDFAIMPSIQTSENVKYLYFLYDPASKKFTFSPIMNPIVNPEVVPSLQHIRSYWRKSSTRSGWHLWKWHNDQPYIATRIEQITNGPSDCQQVTTTFSEDKIGQSSSPVPCR